MRSKILTHIGIAISDAFTTYNRGYVKRSINLGSLHAIYLYDMWLFIVLDCCQVYPRHLLGVNCNQRTACILYSKPPNILYIYNLCDMHCMMFIVICMIYTYVNKSYLLEGDLGR